MLRKREGSGFETKFTHGDNLGFIIVTNADDLAQDSPHLDPQSPEPSVITDGSTSQLMDVSMSGDDPEKSLVDFDGSDMEDSISGIY